MANPFNIGEKHKDDTDKFIQSLFYFFRECHANPLDEEYEVRNPKGNLLYKITKKGITQKLFDGLLNAAKEHYKAEKEAMKKNSKGR